MLLDRNLLRQAKDHRLAFVFVTIAGILSATFVILQARLTAELINAVVFFHAPINHLGFPILLLILVIVFRGVSQVFTEILSARIGLVIKEKLRNLLIEKVQRLGPVYTAGEKKGELLNALTNGIEALDPYFSQYIPQMILAGFIPVTIAIHILPMDTISFLVLLVTAPLLPLFMYLLGSLSERSTNKQWEQLTRLGSHFYDTVQGLNLLIGLNQSKSRGEEIHRINTKYHDLTMGVLKITFLSAFLLEFISTISTAVIAVEIGLRLLSGNLTFVIALFTLLLAPEFYLPLRQLGAKFHSGMSGRAASKKIFEILTDEEPGQAVNNQVNLIFPKQNGIGPDLNSGYFPIIFDKVSANYPGSREMALQDVTFQINEFDKIAIVGKSGMGKTSLTYVLMRLLAYSEGDILFGTHNLKDISEINMGKLLTWVPQNPYLFFGSILENITMFDQEPDLERVSDAIDQSSLRSLVQELPDGIHTSVGERGFQVSVGQAQRIAIARANYRNTPVLVMDEPTASVDPETERLLIDSLQRLTVNKTVVMIAHRLSTIIECDKILVLDNGKIVERGTHRELISIHGQYYQLASGGRHG